MPRTVSKKREPEGNIIRDKHTVTNNNTSICALMKCTPYVVTEIESV